MPSLAKMIKNDGTIIDLKLEAKISVVTPTLGRPKEIAELLKNLAEQTLLPLEIIIVDGAPIKEKATEEAVEELIPVLPFQCRYIRHSRGTAIQRNAGIDIATGDFVAFIDDDIRLDPDFFREVIAAFEKDKEGHVGGIAGYITNQHLDPASSPRWRWYRRLRLFTTYEPGRYDFETGYPINRYLQPPHNGLKEIDFMGAGCVVWHKEIFKDGLRFSEFFKDFGIMEDAHFALRAGRHWTLLECGQARCVHLHSQLSRPSKRRVAWKSAVNYRYLFIEIVPNRTWKQEFRFWRVQVFDLIRFIAYALRSGDKDDLLMVLGKIEGIVAALFLRSGANLGEDRRCNK